MKYGTKSAVIDSGDNGSIIIPIFETIWDRENLRLKNDASKMTAF